MAKHLKSEGIMKRKILAIALGVVAILIFVGSFILWQKNSQVTKQSTDLIALLSFLKSDELAFDGSLQLNKPQNLEAEFKTEIAKANSKTDFILKLPREDKTVDLKGEIISVGDESFLMLNNPVEAAGSLPNDPISRAIKNNLTSVAQEFEGKWIALKQSQTKQTACVLALSQIAQISEEKIAAAYKKYPVVDDYQQEGQKTTISFNEKSSDFMKELFADDGLGCDLAQVQLEITQNEDASEITKLTITTPEQTVELFNIKKGSVDEITAPKESIPFQALEQRISSLFVP